MVNDSVGALHIALAAAVVCWLVFCVSHSIAVWKKRNADGDAHGSRGLLYIGLLLCVAAVGAGWLDRELVRRAGVILGTDFFVVRAHQTAIPHLTQSDSIHHGDNLATFEDPESDRAEAELKGEIGVLEKEIASTALKPLVLDPELQRLSQDASDSQRARLSQLGYGVLSEAPKALNDDALVAGQRAQSQAAQTQFERTAALVREGVVPNAKLDPAVADAKSAAQKLSERQNLIQEAEAGLKVVAHAEAAVERDAERAKAERAAELAELNARLSAMRTNLAKLHDERYVPAPFGGTVVYRHPTPGLAEDGKVILAVAKGQGFLATVQVPAREAAMMEPGQQLRMKLKHSLVSEEVSGRLKSVQPVAGNANLRDLLIECDLPPEQFATFASESIPVSLQWRPPLYTDRVMQGGMLFSCVPMVAWFFMRIRAKLTPKAKASFGDEKLDWSEGWSYLPEEEDLHCWASSLERGFESSRFLLRL